MALTIMALSPSRTDLLYAQPASGGANTGVVVSDTSNRQLTPKDSNTADRITLIDGSRLVGKITEMNASRIIIKVSGQDLSVDPSRVEQIERNIPFDPDADKRRAVEVRTKDGSRYRGTISRSDAVTTYVQTVTGEVSLRNENVESVNYMDVEKVRQADTIAARPQRWELSLKGGAMFYNLGTYKDLLAVGYFGFLQVEAPHFLLPWSIRLTPGLMAGYMQSQGKSTSSTKIGLFPGHLTLGVARQIGSLPLDVFAQGGIGVNLTRVKTAAVAESLALDVSYGAELGFKYYITPNLTARLAGLWLAVSESTATLNHVAAYASVGWIF
ncbi:MAG: hypothetical protein OHK0011_19680 [Turneriella sp.]